MVGQSHHTIRFPFYKCTNVISYARFLRSLRSVEMTVFLPLHYCRGSVDEPENDY